MAGAVYRGRLPISTGNVWPARAVIIRTGWVYYRGAIGASAVGIVPVIAAVIIAAIIIRVSRVHSRGAVCASSISIIPVVSAVAIITPVIPARGVVAGIRIVGAIVFPYNFIIRICRAGIVSQALCILIVNA